MVRIMYIPALCTITIIFLACNHQTVNGSGSDTGREVEERAGGKDVGKEIGSEEREDGRWKKEAINMKGKKQEGEEGVMMVVSPEIVQLKVMREVKKVNRMQQVKKRIESHLLKRLSKRETTVEVDSGEDAIDDAIKRAVKSRTDQLGKEVPSGLPSLEETLNPRLTSTPGKEVNDRKEIKSLVDVVRFPDEAVDKIVDGIQTRLDSLIPERVKKMRHDTEAKAVQVLQPIILRLFNPQSTEGSQIDSSPKESSLSDTLLRPQTLSETLSRPPTPRTQQSNSDSGLSHIFRGVFG